jgi:hypothetical protein
VPPTDTAPLILHAIPAGWRPSDHQLEVLTDFLLAAARRERHPAAPVGSATPPVEEVPHE